MYPCMMHVHVPATATTDKGPVHTVLEAAELLLLVLLQLVVVHGAAGNHTHRTRNSVASSAPTTTFGTLWL
jgi:hypothetical protein